MKNRCYVFSFNRGEYLNNCLISLEKFAVDFFEIVIIDDGSTDQKTREILKKYAKKFKIFFPQKERSSSKTGGLYENMAFALQDAEKENVDFALFIQDDMQVVRKIGEEDLERVQEFFKQNPDSAQLYTCFLKRCNQKWDDENTLLDASKNAYFRPIDGPRRSSFSAVGLIAVPRFLTMFGKLKKSEHENDTTGRERQIKMGLYIYPFMMWLPFPKSYRKGKRGVYHKIKEILANSGFYPYEEMSSFSEERLFHRLIDIRPYAEDFLSCPPVQKMKQWSFTGVNYAFIEMGGWRKLLGKKLIWIEKRISRIRKII
ncbi:MAG: glycosyltransferase [Candidatus Atribacteria bacterium]|nr:glycosyltransferase [Candidatus Atribacteria bacterium]